jgi:hypothetical protein
MGQAYVAFAVEETAVFRLMFGYDAIAPNIDVNQLIAGATPGLLAGSPRHSKD